MNYKELIMEYFDQGIDEGREDILFAAMGQDTELRREFSHYIKLHSMAALDASSIVVPLKATNSIFSQLGFNVPNKSFVDNTLISQSSAQRISSVLVLIFAFFMAGSLFVMETMLDIHNINSNQNYTASDIPILNSIESVLKPKSTIPLVSSIEDENSNSSQNSAVDKLNMLGARTNNSNLSNSGLNSSALENERANSNDFAGNVSERNINFIEKSANINNNSGLDENANLRSIADNNSTDNRIFASSQQLPFSTLSSFSGSENNRYSLEMRSFYSQDIPNVNIANNFQLNDNYSMSLRYAFNDENILGIEFGRQRFAQVFNFSQSTYEQKPAVAYFGINYRYLPYSLRFANYFSPYSEIFAGGTSFGPIYKLQSGIRYSAFSNVSTLMGFEYGGLIYNVEGRMYHSSKYGLFLGFSLDF